MTKVSAGVLTGILLGVLYGLYGARTDLTATTLSASLLGRASQGIINGVLAAYVNKGATPLWRGAFWGGLIGVLLGVLAGISTHAFPASLIPSAILGLGCGLATAKAKR